MYSSAGRFSTPLKTFSSRRVFRPSIEQGALPPVLWSGGGGLRPPPPGGVFFPQLRCNVLRNLYKIYIYATYIPTRFNKLSTCFDNLGLDLNMSDARFNARKMHVTSLKYLIKALDSYGMLIMSLKAVYALVVCVYFCVRIFIIFL